jgi:hypothetical protein
MHLAAAASHASHNHHPRRVSSNFIALDHLNTGHDRRQSLRGTNGGQGGYHVRDPFAGIDELDDTIFGLEGLQDRGPKKRARGLGLGPGGQGVNGGYSADIGGSSRNGGNNASARALKVYSSDVVNPMLTPGGGHHATFGDELGGLGGVPAFSNGVDTDLDALGGGNSVRQAGYVGADRRPWYIMEPSNTFHVALWDPLVAFLILYSVSLIPVQLGFDVEPKDMMLVIDLLVDCLFAIDIFINFVTAFRDPLSNDLVVQPGPIAVRYLRTWFAVDFLSTVPFARFVAVSTGSPMYFCWEHGECGNTKAVHAAAPGGGLAFVRALRLVRLLKLARLLKLGRFITKMETEFEVNPALTRLGTVLIQVIFLSHLLACFWHFLTIDSKYEPQVRAAGGGGGGERAGRYL